MKETDRAVTGEDASPDEFFLWAKDQQACAWLAERWRELFDRRLAGSRLRLLADDTLGAIACNVYGDNCAARFGIVLFGDQCGTCDGPPPAEHQAAVHVFADRLARMLLKQQGSPGDLVVTGDQELFNGLLKSLDEAAPNANIICQD